MTTPFRPSENMGNALYILHGSLQLQHSLKYTHIFLLRVESLLHSPLQLHYKVDDNFWINSHSCRLALNVLVLFAGNILPLQGWILHIYFLQNRFTS